MSSPRNMPRVESAIERESQAFCTQSQQGELDSQRRQHHILQCLVGHGRDLDIILKER